ncbi:helix-turn-helix domain-containing protein [uncultured Aeromicrobium sp.]|uniref:PucR family transcriptional regulator n=1 Tax=uncultured Aeromicrobium sp. TaxID=337820 RepID=UPI0025D39F29|nr:helix-turn-helix domain-containing protein [uncultured Aeromicrobium sp.]
MSVVEDLLNRSLEPLVGADDILVQTAVRSAMSSFTSSKGNPERAALEVAELFWEVGDRHARRQRTQEELDTSFRRIREASGQGLRFVLRPGTTPEQLHVVQRALGRYLELLYRHTILGWERRRILTERETKNIPRPDRASRPSDPDRLAALRRRLCLSGDAPYRAVVAVEGCLGEGLREVPESLADDDLSEVLLPEHVCSAQIAAFAGAQCVIGPVVPLARVAESARIARRGASALRSRTVESNRTAVPYEDLAHAIVIETDSPLTEVIVSRNVHPLAGLPPQRRLVTAEFLLEWLQRGTALSQLARDLNIPKQTAHYRMNAARNLFGDALDNPEKRFELIVALRCVLPRWRNEVASSG